MTSPIRIFISYSRKDGRDLALSLQKSLSDLLYEVWLDTNKLHGGANWSRDIEQAIDNCHVVLALLSPASFESEICRAEHQRAVEKKKRIIPIMVLPCDRPLILQTLNYRDFTNLGAYDTSLSQLQDDLKNPDGYTSPTIKTIYNNAPPLPPHFIPRPDEYNKLKNALLSDTTDRQVALTALQGLGGIGKSVMANAVCKDDFLAGAFPDGVFWVEIGREPSEIPGKLKTIGVQLGDSEGNYVTLNDAMSSFRNIIARKSALIVLDDVWDESYKVANYFIGTSPRTRWLVTTRNQAIVNELDATPVQLGMMHPDQAVALMREWAGRDDDQFATITKRLGYHPLAVKIVGTRLKGMKSTDWLNSYDITRVKMGLSAHDRDDNLVACFEVSVNSLPPELPPLYHALGIFPEDKWIPESIVAQLWMALNPDLAEFDCTDILTELAKLALVDRQADTAEIRMHDLLHDYNRFKIKAEYVQMQARFISALGDPYHLRHEYAWRYYAYHLIEAGQQNRLRELLLDYPFLDAKLNATDVSALIEDCGLVLAHGKDEPIRLIQSALQMSSHVLDKDKKALAHQLAGRLMHHYTKVDEIHTFLDSITPPKNSLFPINNGYDPLNPAGGMMLRTMKHEDRVTGAVELADGRILSWSRDNTLRLWDGDGSPIATLTGHTSYVNGAIELGDGRLLSWSWDNTLRLWNVDGTPIATMVGHKDSVRGGVELGDRRILSWSEDKTLRLWGADGTPIATLTGHTSYVTGAVELADGRILSWSWDNTLRLWNVDGTPIATLSGHTSYVTGAIELGDGRLLSWSWDNTLRLWNVDGTPIATLSGHTREVNGAVQLVGGRILSWSVDSTLRLWEADGSPIASLTGHTGSVYGAVQLADGRILSWSVDSTLRLWEADGSEIAALTGHKYSVNGAIELSDGRILSWSYDNTLRLWDADGSPIATLTGHTDDVRGATVLADGRILSWAGSDNRFRQSTDKTLRLWDGDGSPIATLTGHTSSVCGAEVLADGRILSWSVDSTLRLWDGDGSPIATLTGHTDYVRGAMELADGRILSWAGSDNRFRQSTDKTLRLWDGDGTPIATLTGHTSYVRGAMELADGRILSWAGSDFGSTDKTLRLWDGDGTPIATLTGHTSSICGAEVLVGGRILSWSDDNTLRLWEADGSPIATLTGHTRGVSGAVVLVGGRLLSWSGDKTLRLWDGDGTPIATLTGHTSYVRGAMELADGRILSWAGSDFGSTDKTLRLWDGDGTPIATLTGHTSSVCGAEVLVGGRILSWSDDNTLRLWDGDGSPIAVLEQNYRWGNRTIIAQWAGKHGYTLDDFYPPQKDLLMAGGRVQDNGTDLIIYHPQTGKKIHAFYGDAPFSGGVVVLAGGRVLVAGDNVGRVLFLRWVGEDGV